MAEASEPKRASSEREEEGEERVERKTKDKKKGSGGSGGKSSALERLKQAKASLEEQKGRSASARRFHTMSTADRNEFLSLRHATSSPTLSTDDTSAPHFPGTSSSSSVGSPSSPDSPKSPTLRTASSTDFLRRLRQDKLGWTAPDGKEETKKEDEPPKEATPVPGSGSGVGNFFREERKRLQQEAGASSGSVVRSREGEGQTKVVAGGATLSVMDVLQAGSVVRSRENDGGKVKSEEKEKENGPPVKLRTSAAWLSATEQKRSLSTIKRTKEEKLKALEQLQSQLQQKRADINAHKEKQQQNEELLAQMVPFPSLPLFLLSYLS
jgi:hypothetical protein